MPVIMYHALVFYYAVKATVQCCIGTICSTKLQGKTQNEFRCFVPDIFH